MFPDMSDAFAEWSDARTCSLIKKDLIDGRVRESKSEAEFDILIIPMRAQQIQAKPEGQRTWRWQTGVSATELAMDDRVRDGETEYRVMGKQDYRIAGFYVYDLTEDYQ